MGGGHAPQSSVRSSLHRPSQPVIITIIVVIVIINVPIIIIIAALYICILLVQIQNRS